MFAVLGGIAAVKIVGDYAERLAVTATGAVRRNNAAFLLWKRAQ